MRNEVTLRLISGNLVVGNETADLMHRLLSGVVEAFIFSGPALWKDSFYQWRGTWYKGCDQKG